MTYHSVVSSGVFAKLVSGQMVIEPRLNDHAHRKVKIGDFILFVNRESREEQLAKITGLLRFDSFVELFHAYPPERFGAESEQELLKAMKHLYTAQQETEHGVLGIKVHVLKKA